MSKITREQLIEAVKGMTVLELSELVKAFEERYGVTAAAPMAMAATEAMVFMTVFGKIIGKRFLTCC